MFNIFHQSPNLFRNVENLCFLFFIYTGKCSEMVTCKSCTGFKWHLKTTLSSFLISLKPRNSDNVPSWTALELLPWCRIYSATDSASKCCLCMIYSTFPDESLPREYSLTYGKQKYLWLLSCCRASHWEFSPLAWMQLLLWICHLFAETLKIPEPQSFSDLTPCKALEPTAVSYRNKTESFWCGRIKRWESLILIDFCGVGWTDF